MNKLGLMGVILVISLIAVFSTGSRVQPGNVSSPAVKDTADKAQVAIDKNYGKMPLSFIPNKEQMDRQVYFYLHRPDLCPGRANRKPAECPGQSESLNAFIALGGKAGFCQCQERCETGVPGKERHGYFLL